jgi:hypothetical protein
MSHEVATDNEEQPHVKFREKKPGQAWMANGIFVIYTHIVSILMLCFYRPPRQTIYLTFASWFLAGIGMSYRMFYNDE